MALTSLSSHASDSRYLNPTVCLDYGNSNSAANDLRGSGRPFASTFVRIREGFLFALLVLAISVVSFPLLLDRDVGLYTAVRTSIRALAANPGPMAVWGLIVAAGLVIGSIPAFLGLVIVMPVLGHATWQLYRKVVA